MLSLELFVDACGLVSPEALASDEVPEACASSGASAGLSLMSSASSCDCSAFEADDEPASVCVEVFELDGCLL